MGKTENPKGNCNMPINDFKTAQRIAFEVENHYRLKAYKNEEERNERNKK